MNPNQQHRFQYNLALLSAGSATVSVQQLVGSTYQTLATANANSASGSYSFAFTPTSSNIRILVSSNTRFALNNLYLDRDHVDTLVETYALYAGGYRYTFNGMESDNEVKGTGNSYDFGNRIHDPRLGRFLSMDKYANKFAYQSPYLYAGNNPIWAIDVNGDSLKISTSFWANANLKSAINIFTSSKAVKKFSRKFSTSSDMIDVTNGKDGKFSTNTHLFFGTQSDNPSVGSAFALTDIEIQDASGNWVSLESNLSSLSMADINQNANVRMRFDVNTALVGTLGIDLQTFNHEFSVHIRPYQRLIKKLRSGKLEGQDFVDKWNKVSSRGRYNNGYTQHKRYWMWSKISSYGRTHRQLKKQLSNSDSNDMQKESDRDIKQHKNTYK